MAVNQEKTVPSAVAACHIALLTGGADKPYALGMASALVAQGVHLDFIGSDDVDGPELHGVPQIEFLNLRGEQSTSASSLRKLLRVLKYYIRLIGYAATAKPKTFHIQWNNKFEGFDRTVLMAYYKLLGKRIVFTAHNVNAGERDGSDSWLNRLTLRIQYRLSDHIFVHTKQMADELSRQFDVPGDKISVIPFGINSTLPKTSLSISEAKHQLGVSASDKTMLFFGNIAPYKGLDVLIEALAECGKRCRDYRLIIGGRPKGCPEYWSELVAAMRRSGMEDRIIQKIEYIPDEAVEVFFKAADVLVLPYTHIFQSGVLFLGYDFGLPVIATDVGSLKEDIVEGRTGFVCHPKDSADLARAIDAYFASDLFKQLPARRQSIQNYARERYSWEKVGAITTRVYQELTKN